MSNWGVMKGIGQGLSQFSSIMREHRINAWDDMKEELRYQRQENLAKLQMQHQTKLQDDQQSFLAKQQTTSLTHQANQNQLNRAATASEGELDRKSAEKRIELQKAATKDVWQNTQGLARADRIAAAEQYKEQAMQKNGGELDTVDNLIYLQLRHNVDFSGIIDPGKEISAEMAELAYNIASQEKGFDKKSPSEQTALVNKRAHELKAKRGSILNQRDGGQIKSLNDAEVKVAAEKLKGQPDEVVAQYMAKWDAPSQAKVAAEMAPKKKSSPRGGVSVMDYMTAKQSENPGTPDVVKKVKKGMSAWEQANQGYMGIR